MAATDTSITALFLEYLRAHEEQREPDREGLIERAGEEAGELRGRIAVFESMQGMAARIKGTPLPDSGAQPLASGRFGRFDILKLIADGGMGTVYLARDPELERLVALKLLHPLVLGDRASRDLILNEARSLAQLEHPGVVKVLQIESHEGRDHVVMDFVPGPSLAEVIQRLREPTPEEDLDQVTRGLRDVRARLACLARLAEALAYCHGCGVVHRDVKPSNVLFDGKGDPVLIDFGLAHVADEAGGDSNLMVTQRLVGTPAYLAPEQVEAMQTGRDPRSDQFSLGVLAYEFLTLEQPFQRKTRTATLDAVTSAEPERPARLQPGLPADAERVLLRTLERRPEERYASVRLFVEDLRAVLEHRPVSVGKPSLWRRSALWLRRNRARVAVAAVGGVLVAASLFGRAIVEGKRRDDGIRARLAALQVGDLQDPLGILDAGHRLEELQTEVRAAEGSALRLFSPGPGDAVQSKSVRWSEHLRERLTAEIEASDEGSGEFQLPLVWSRVLYLEARILPEAEDAQGYRDRGQVFLHAPEDVELTIYAQTQDPNPRTPEEGMARFHEVRLTSAPVSGSYRVHGWREGHTAPAYQLEFVVTNVWQPALHLELREPAEYLQDAMIDVPRHASGERSVPAFRISPVPVTRGEFLDYLAATGAAEPDTFDLNSDPEAPAWVDQASAVAYARWVGARLPSAVEFDEAESAGAIEQLAGPHVSHGEWLSDVPFGSGPRTSSFVHYQLFEQHRSGTYPHLMNCLQPIQRLSGVEGPGGTGVCFRLALSSDEPRMY